MNHAQVEEVLDILSPRLTPAQVATWMNMTFAELGGATPRALLAAGDIKPVVRLAQATAKIPQPAS